MKKTGKQLLKEAAESKVQEFDYWICKKCGYKQMSTDEVKKHLKSVHQVKELKGTQQMVMHLDGSNFFQSTFVCDVEGIKLTHNVRTKRDAESSAYWK